jgi:PPOX class probable F420-dependent enzyme
VSRADLDLVRRLALGDNGLAVVSTTRPDGTIQSSVVNASVLPDPDGGGDVVGLVARGGSRKLDHLRDRPRVTVAFRVGWEWASVEGPTRIVGPDESPAPDPEALRVLLRDVFAATGRPHDDWDEYDRVMREERRAVVLVTPERITSN